MKRLTLLRHAKSSWKHPELADFDRPLSGRGRKEIRRMGKRLERSGIAPDLIIASPARRTRKTARRIARRLGYPKSRIVEERAVYEADPQALLAVLRKTRRSVGHVLLVGHNPGLTDLANALLGQTVDNIPTCGVVSAQFPITSWRKLGEDAGTLLLFDHPKAGKTPQ